MNYVLNAFAVKTWQFIALTDLNFNTVFFMYKHYDYEYGWNGSSIGK